MTEILAGHRRSIFQHSCETTTVGKLKPTKCNPHNVHSTSYCTTTTNDKALLEHRDVERKCLLHCDPLCVYTHIHKEISINHMLPFTQNKNKKKIRKTTLTNGIYKYISAYVHIYTAKSL